MMLKCAYIPNTPVVGVIRNVVRPASVRSGTVGRPASRMVVARAQVETDDDSCDYIASDYCGIDPETGKKAARRSVGEMEQEFLSALGAYYFEGKSTMPDDEFNLLKEELIWSGSKVAILDVEEQKFLEASMMISKGKKVMSDEDYEALKMNLKMKGSVVAAEGPRCSLENKKMYSDADPDYLKMTLLNLPAALIVLGSVFVADFLTDFKITTALELPLPVGPALLWGIVLPGCYVIAASLTNIAFKNSVILKGPCPNCGTENYTFFGEVLTVEGNRGTVTTDCTNCNALLSFDEDKRLIVVTETPEERAKKAPKKAPKKVPAKQE